MNHVKNAKNLVMLTKPKNGKEGSGWVDKNSKIHFVNVFQGNSEDLLYIFPRRKCTTVTKNSMT